MTITAPIFASKRSAAKLLDMKLAEFCALVENGHLPKPRDIGGLKRWDTEELQRIIRGDAVEGAGDIQW